MATTTRTSILNEYGSSGWTGSGTNQQIGNNFHIRETFNVGGIQDLGTITGLSCVVDPVSTAAMNGTLYVTADSTVTGNTITNATSIGTWALVSGGASQTMTVGNFNGAAFKSAIGSASTWYLIWAPVAGMVLRYLMVKSYHPVWTITYTPGSCSVNVAGSMRKGEPWVNVAGTWRKGVLWTNIGGTWKQGI